MPIRSGLLALLAAASAATAAPAKSPLPGGRDLVLPFAPAAVAVVLDDRMPLSKLSPGALVPDLCVFKYRVGTASAECQAFVDQALGYYYSYVWMEAARSAETAAKLDPECAYAWLVLHRALDKWGGKADAAKAALKKAQELLPKAGYREQQLITARLHERGLIDGVAEADRKKKAQSTLDNLLTVHDDDQEGWMSRRAPIGGLQTPPPRRAVSTRRCSGSTRSTPGRTTNSSTSTRTQAARPGVAVRRGVHPVVARHPARLPHAGPPRHPHRQVGQDHRLVGPRRRNRNGRTTRPSRVNAGRGPPVHPPPGNPDARPDPRRPVRGGPRIKKDAEGYKFTVPRRSGSGWPWPSATGPRREAGRRNPQDRQAAAAYLAALAALEKGDTGAAKAEVEVLPRPSRTGGRTRSWNRGCGRCRGG